VSTVALALCAQVKEIKVYFVTYGIMYGIGQSLLLAATLGILPHYFNKRLSFANGLMNFGAAIIVVLLPIFTAPIINNYGIVSTFYFLASLNFATFLLGFLFIPQLPNQNKNERLIVKIKESFGLEIFKMKKFNVWCVASFIGNLSFLSFFFFFNINTNILAIIFKS
jgi:MFS family permease